MRPHTSILGTDISPIQPEAVPRNCNFLVDDATLTWAFGQKFDLIHTRAITMGIGDWDRLVHQAWDHLKPGGWIELQEFYLPLQSDDGTMHEGTAMWKWGQNIKSGLAKVGINSTAALEHADRLRSRGFQDVKQIIIKIPIGPWARGRREKKVGLMAQKDLHDGIEGMTTKLMLNLGHSADELKEFLENCRTDIMNPAIHCYIPM